MFVIEMIHRLEDGISNTVSTQGENHSTLEQ